VSDSPATPIAHRSIIERLRGAVRELAKFGIVGLIGMVVDIGGSNLLVLGPLTGKPLTASGLSMIAATFVTYFGNRHWTWKDRDRRSVRREYTLFFALNAIALGIGTALMAFTTYVLNLDSHLWFNIAKVLGIGLGTLFRFWSYRRFVFTKAVDPNAAAWEETAHTTA
jgi:putative flippase GtrA